jgi:hypothetical protein
MSGEELNESAAWIRQRSQQLREECRDAGQPYVDVRELGFESHARGAPPPASATIRLVD